MGQGHQGKAQGRGEASEHVLGPAFAVSLGEAEEFASHRDSPGPAEWGPDWAGGWERVVVNGPVVEVAAAAASSTNQNGHSIG